MVRVDAAQNSHNNTQFVEHGSSFPKDVNILQSTDLILKRNLLHSNSEITQVNKESTNSKGEPKYLQASMQQVENQNKNSLFFDG